MLYGLADIAQRQRFIDGSGAPEEQRRVERQRLNALLGVCETTECRRRALLRSFGEELAQPCGNCDVCLAPPEVLAGTVRSEEHTSELTSLMRISYAVFCSKKKKIHNQQF